MSLAGRVEGIVAAACARARLVAVAGLLLGLVSLAYVATHFAINTDTEQLISQDVVWRRDATAFDRAFPGKSDQIVVVVDGQTAELAEGAAAALTASLQGRTDLFRAVSRPAGGPFFDREGLLFLSQHDMQTTLDGLLAAQPLLGPLAADPSLRGALGSLTTALGQVRDGSTPLAKLQRPMRDTADVISAALAGRRAWFPWSDLVGEPAEAGDLRRLVLLEPKLDYAELMPGARATQAVRQAAAKLGLTPANGVRVRITGSVPLDDEQLGTLAEGAPAIAGAMLVFVVGVLWLAVRSPKTILAILATVAVGLLATAAFGLLAFGRFNLISVAFIALFVGLGVDFAIQFAVRFRAELAEGVAVERAPAAAGRHVGGALAIAAAATAIGFFAFSPTHYVGFSELGVIAGVGMMVAFLLSLTLLPALLVLLRPSGGGEDPGFGALAPLGRAIARRRRAVLFGFAGLAVISACVMPWVRFDFDPVSLDSPRTESVSTLRDLARNPDTTLNTLDVLAPSAAAGAALAKRLEALPEVARAVTLTSFVPDNQAAELPLIADAANLLDPTVNPFDTQPPPSDAESLQAFATTRDTLLQAAASNTGAPAAQARRLAGLLSRLAQASPQARRRAEGAITATLPTLLARIRSALTAQPVSLSGLPADLLRDWRTADGRVRIEIFPKGDANDVATIDRFVAAVARVAPDAAGAPVAVRGSRTTILNAFGAAMALSTAAIVILLLVVLGKVRDVALTLAPVALAALLTFATCVALGMAINFENIVGLPLLVSVGAAFTIYFTLAWRRGQANLLDTSVARAVVFSALTTGLAFGSLCLSPHPGTFSLGVLLMVSLGWTLVCTLVLQPALLGPPPMPRDAGASASL